MAGTSASLSRVLCTVKYSEVQRSTVQTGTVRQRSGTKPKNSKQIQYSTITNATNAPIVGQLDNNNTVHVYVLSAHSQPAQACAS